MWTDVLYLLFKRYESIILSMNPEILECHCCKHIDVWMYINCPCILLHTNLLLSQACSKLPKYLLRSCQHLSAQQLEKLWCISSVSFRPWPEHPFLWGAEGIKKQSQLFSTDLWRSLSCQSTTKGLKVVDKWSSFKDWKDWSALMVFQMQQICCLILSSTLGINVYLCRNSKKKKS